MVGRIHAWTAGWISILLWGCPPSSSTVDAGFTDARTSDGSTIARDAAASADAAIARDALAADSSANDDAMAGLDSTPALDAELVDTGDAEPLDVGDAAVGPISYTTDFDGTENPLSEGGAWSHLGLDWTVAVKSGGFAYGSQTGVGGYDDSYAYLSGFPPDQTASAVVHLSGTIDGSCSHEVEILLRWSDSAHSAQGYECNLSFNGGYLQIVRWEGPLGGFTVLNGGSVPGLNDGDTLQASIVGTRITIALNGNAVVSVDDPTYAAGNPGVGFFRRECGANSDFGFTHFSATGL